MPQRLSGRPERSKNTLAISRERKNTDRPGRTRDPDQRCRQHVEKTAPRCPAVSFGPNARELDPLRATTYGCGMRRFSISSTDQTIETRRAFSTEATSSVLETRRSDADRMTRACLTLQTSRWLLDEAVRGSGSNRDSLATQTPPLMLIWRAPFRESLRFRTPQMLRSNPSTLRTKRRRPSWPVCAN